MRRRLLMSQEKRIIPKEYTLLNYIESTGAEWIDLEYMPNSNIDIKFDFQYIGIANEAYSTTTAFGVRDTSNATTRDGWYGLFVGTRDSYLNKAYINYNTTDVGFAVSNITERKVLTSQKNRFFMDNSLVVTAVDKTFQSTMSMYLFAVNAQGKEDFRYIKMRVFSFEIYDNGVLVRNFLPVQRKSDNVIGIYETVTKTFLTNKGTGAFIGG